MAESIIEAETKRDAAGLVLPELPHVEVNQIQLSVIIRNLCIYSVTEMKQFFKLVVPNQRQELLKLVIYLRNQFLRLYVLIKWVKTIKSYNFHILIDLLNYLRIKNMNVGQCIWNLKNIVINSTINAKLPKPDLETAVEVFALGAPQLTDNSSFFEKLHKLRAKTTPRANYISNDLILKRLEDLDVTLSVKIATTNVPKKFLEGTKSIKDGKWVIEIAGEYELVLSTLGDDLPFYLVHLKFLLSSAAVDMANYQTNKNQYLQINNKLKANHDNVLYDLEELLTKKILFLRIFLCKQILENHNKTKGKFDTPLQVIYDESSITVRYWIHSHIAAQEKDCTINISIKEDGFGEEKLKLNLHWNMRVSEQVCQFLDVKTNYTENVFENLIDYIMKIIDDHVKILKYSLFRLGNSFFASTEGYEIPLRFTVPINCKDSTMVDLDIDKRSGKFFMLDKHNIINSQYLFKRHADLINQMYLAPSELVKVLQNMNVNFSIKILQDMFLKMGWCVHEESQIDIGDLNKSSKMKKTFIRMKNWPLNWYLIVSNEIESNREIYIKIRIAKLLKENNKWKIKHLSELLQIDQKTNSVKISLNQVTYEKVSELQSTILTKIINNSILDIFAELKLDVIEFSTDVESLKFLPYHIQDKITSGTSSSSTSLFGIKSQNYITNNEFSELLKPILFLLINSENDIQLYGSFSSFIDTSYLQKCNTKELEITFVDSQSFYLDFKDNQQLNSPKSDVSNNDKMKSSLNRMKQILISYKSRLQHLMVLISTITRLVESFPEENFQVVKMNSDEICFNYLPKFNKTYDGNSYDCKIKLDNYSVSKGLSFELSDDNPQKILHSVIDTANVSPLNHQAMFKYFHMTSLLFSFLENLKFLQKEKNLVGPSWNYEFHIHGISEFKLDYYFETENIIECINVLISIQHVANGIENSDLRYKISAYLPSTKKLINKAESPNSSRVSGVLSNIQKSCFQIIDPSVSADPAFMNGAMSVVKLNDCLSCSGEDIYKVMNYIHKMIVSQQP